jgi:hypothetical protein
VFGAGDADRDAVGRLVGIDNDPTMPQSGELQTTQTKIKHGAPTA